MGDYNASRSQIWLLGRRVPREIEAPMMGMAPLATPIAWKALPNWALE